MTISFFYVTQEPVPQESPTQETSLDEVAIQLEGISENRVLSGMYEITDGNRENVQSEGNNDMTPKVSFADIFQQIKDKDVQQRQLEINEGSVAVNKVENRFIGKY